MARSRLSCILLLDLVLGTGFVRGALVQQPALFTGLMGSSVTLTCTLQCQGRGVEWSSSRWDVYHNNTTKAIWRRSEEKTTLEATFQEETRHVVHHTNYTSSLEIKSLKISDGGTYICTIYTIIPPPIREEKGNGTVLRVLAPPQLWLSLSPADESSLAVVLCAVSEFYPDSIDVTVASTCGGFQDLDHNTTPIKNPDGTYNTMRRARLNTTGCADGTEVTCSAKHETGEWSKKLRISGSKNKGLAHGVPPEFLIRTGVFAAFLCIICAIFLTYNMCCYLPKEESIGCMRRKPEASLDTGHVVQEN